MNLLLKKDKPRVIVIGLIYSETYSLLRDSGRTSNCDAIFLGLQELERLSEVLTEDVGMVITETITNPLCGVPDLECIGKLANANLSLILLIYIQSPATTKDCDCRHWNLPFHCPY